MCRQLRAHREDAAAKGGCTTHPLFSTVMTAVSWLKAPEHWQLFPLCALVAKAFSRSRHIAVVAATITITISRSSSQGSGIHIGFAW